MWFNTLTWALCLLVITQSAQVWFGPNQQYLCHCVNDQCNPDGSCKSGSKCSLGWFGKTCQYVDLLGHFNNMHILTDNDENTCLGITTEHVNLPLGAEYPTVQVRFVYKKGMKDITTPDTTFICGSRKYVVDNEVVDYFCDIYTVVSNIKLSGKTLNNLCSVYFSGGRNVALKQQVKQSSHYYNIYPASLAVDGTSDNCERVFSHTSDADANPSFELLFGTAMTVSKVRIFNRGGGASAFSLGTEKRLKGFEMEVFDSGSNVLFRYKDTKDVQMVYDLDVKLLRGATKINIKQKEKPPGVTQPIISICELEVFGDCDNGFWDLDCKRCSGLCSRACHKETGQCQDCSIGTWGLDCQNKCDSSCSNDCDTETGQCIKKDCPDGFWGLDCKNNCDNRCSRPCHKETGQCFRKECDAGHWGLDCQAKCDENCANPCHPETGQCKRKTLHSTSNKYGLIEHIRTYTWVGPKKKYRCNCRGDHCYINGTCWPAEKCSLGWFGKHCQYVDHLATYDDTNVVTDGDDFTCMHESLSSLTLELGGEFPVTLVRLVTRAELGIGKAIEIEFQGKSSTFKCTDAKIYTEHHTKDIFCRNNERANKLVLKGPGLSTLCSVYFSGGRNFALRQTVVQKPKSEFPNDIVDSNLWNCAYDDLQSENAKDNAFVEIQFDKSVSINRFKLHKRIFGDEDDQNAIHFLLEAFDAQSKSLLNYKHDQPPQKVFDLIIEQIKNVSKIKISQIGSDTARFITFCEIEVFGDCDDGSWGWDCKNKCVQSCSNFCHKETGKC